MLSDELPAMNILSPQSPGGGSSSVAMSLMDAFWGGPPRQPG